MPAYFDTGFSVRQTPWHGQGLVLDDYPTDWADARVKAGLLWEPELVPSYRKLADGTFEEVPGQRFVERNDTHDIISPRTLSDEFALVQHSVMGEILESVLGQTNVKFETAGSVKNGGSVWALAYLDEPIVVAGDNTETYPFFALLNSHDGSGACKLVATSIRVVCWNTYSAASLEGERTGRQFIFRHVGDVLGRIEQAKLALSGVREETAHWAELATELLGLPADDRALEHFLSEFIPAPEADVVSDRVRDNIDKARAAFKHIYLDSITCSAHRGTALGLLDASVEYLDHIRAYRNSDTYLGRTLLRPEPLKGRALKLVREVCR